MRIQWPGHGRGRVLAVVGIAFVLLFVSGIRLPGQGPQDLRPSLSAGSLAVPSPGTALTVSWFPISSYMYPMSNASITLYQGGPVFPLLFGGTGTCGQFCNSTWGYLYSLGTEVWANITPLVSPSVRSHAALAWDPTRGGAILFGGEGPSGPLNDTWLYVRDVGWTELHPTASPPARYGAAFTYDAADGYLLLFGGEGARGPLGDTWAFTGSTWENLTTSTGPSPRQGAEMVYDPGTGHVYLFGGKGTAGYPTGTWQFRGGAWTRVTSPGNPPPRAYASLVTTGAGYPLLFGGQGPAGELNDTWVLENDSWSSVENQGLSPPPLAGSMLANVANLGPNDFVLFGGYRPSGVTADSWSLFAPFGGSPNGSAPLRVTLTSSGTGGPAPYQVTLSADITGGSPPYTLVWAFGDGSGGPGATVVQHTYTTPGNFQASVVVTDVSGQTASAVLPIHVVAPAAPVNPWLSFLGGPGVWTLLGLGGALLGIVGYTGLSEGVVRHRLRRAVGVGPSRIRRSAHEVVVFSRGGTWTVLLARLRGIWLPPSFGTPRGRGLGPVSTRLVRRLLLVVPQLLLGTTTLYLFSEVVTGLVQHTYTAGDFPTGWWTFNAELFTGHWGMVLVNGSPVAPVLTVVGYYLPYTIELAVPALLLATLIAYPLGLLSAWNQGRSLDNATRILAAFGAFFSLIIIVLLLSYFFYQPFTAVFGDSPFGSLPSGLWFSIHYGGYPSWVGYFGQTSPTGFPVLDAPLNGAWAAEGLILAKILFQSVVIGLAYAALFLRYARLGAVGGRQRLNVVASLSRGVPERRLLWRDTSRQVLPVYIFTFGNTFALYLLIQSLTEWFFNDTGVGAYLIFGAFHAGTSTGGPSLLAVMAFLILLLIVVVNTAADVVSHWLDPRLTRE